MIKNNLLYVYDEESKAISPMPASPYLLPAIVGYGLLWFVSILVDSFNGTGIGHRQNVSKSRGVDYETWKVYRDKYLLLVKKREDYGLTSAEIQELYLIQHPPWAKPDEVWTYK